MKRAEYTDKRTIVNILTTSFDDNKSINYIIKRGPKRVQRIKALMEYSFDMCYLFGDVFLSDDKKGSALILLPDKKKTNLKSIFLDIKLIIAGIGLANIMKAMRREAQVEKVHPKTLIYYLWFIGVDPKEQNKGIGSALLKEVIEEGLSKQRPIYLETSTSKNIPWYEKFGFKIYHELDFSYRLFFLKKE